MIEEILNLKGVTVLEKEQQKMISGGKVACEDPVFSHIEEPGEGAIIGAHDFSLTIY